MHGRDEAGELQPDLRQAVEDDEQLHQQRRAADDRDVDARAARSSQRVRRHPRQGREPAAITSPTTKLMTVSGMVPLTSPPQHRPRRRPCTTSHVRRASEPFDLDLAGSSDGDVGLEVLLGDLRAGCRRPERLRAPCPPGRAGAASALRKVSACSADLVAGVADDLDVLRPGRGQVVEHGDVVVDDRVDPALDEQLGRLGEALDRPDLRAGVAGDLRPVAGLRLRGRACPSGRPGVLMSSVSAR